MQIYLAEIGRGCGGNDPLNQQINPAKCLWANRQIGSSSRLLHRWELEVFAAPIEIEIFHEVVFLDATGSEPLL